jgi:hypothetical protein
MSEWWVCAEYHVRDNILAQVQQGAERIYSYLQNLGRGSFFLKIDVFTNTPLPSSVFIR